MNDSRCTELSVRNGELAREVSRLSVRNGELAREVSLLSGRIGRARSFFAGMKQNKSLRAAKLLQILKHPEIAGCRGPFHVLWRIIFSRKPLAEDYSVFSVPDRILEGGDDPRP